MEVADAALPPGDRQIDKPKVCNRNRLGVRSRIGGHAVPGKWNVARRQDRALGIVHVHVLHVRQVADDAGQTAWISGAAAIAVFDRPLYPGETTEAGPLWLFDNFGEVKEMGSCSPPFMAEVAKALGERYEPA